jgi:GT2 family glycosyltransferase
VLLSIIIVNYRGWKRLRQCLDSIQNLNPEAEKIEVIVVDNQSADGQLEIFKNQFPEFIFFENSGNFGFAHGCNTGASLAKGTNYIFLNPDTILNTAALNGLTQLTGLLSKKVMFSCTQVTDNGKDTHPYGYFLNLKTLNPLARSLRSFILGKPKTITLASGHHAFSPEWISGSLILISKTSFNELGGWNQDYWMYFEDMDLCKRFKSLGGTIYLVTDFSVIHNHGGASRINAETRALTKAEVMISRHVYVQKHLSGISNLTSQLYLVISNLFFEPLLLALAGLILFFNPKVFTYTIRYFNLLNYYVNALRNSSWLSPRSVNFHS